jgi:hypothetical protein
MGDSQVACALSGAPIYDECVVIVLGPGGYGDHSAPPKLAAGGCHFGPISRRELIYAPLTLPIRARVGSYHGAIEQCLDNEHDQWLRKHWGASALEIVNAAIEDGRPVGDGFKTHAAYVDYERSSMWDEFDTSDAGIEARVAAARAKWQLDFAAGRLTPYLIEQGVEDWTRQAREYALGTRLAKEAAKRGVYNASWADAVHVRADVWNELVVQQDDNDEDSFCTLSLCSLSPFSQGMYEKHRDEPHIQALSEQLERFVGYALSGGHLMPSVIFNHDSDIAKKRARMHDVAARLARR